MLSGCQTLGPKVADPFRSQLQKYLVRMVLKKLELPVLNSEQETLVTHMQNQIEDYANERKLRGHESKRVCRVFGQNFDRQLRPRSYCGAETSESSGVPANITGICQLCWALIPIRMGGF